jgi:hypothetical protein
MTFLDLHGTKRPHAGDDDDKSGNLSMTSWGWESSLSVLLCLGKRTNYG